MNLFLTRLKRLFSCSRLCPYIWQNQKRIAEQVEPLGWKSHLLNNADTSSLSHYWLSRAVWFTRVGFSCLTDKAEEGEIHANQTAFLMKNTHLKLKTRIQYFGCIERGRNPEKLVLGTSRKWNARIGESETFPSAQLRTRSDPVLCQGELLQGQDRWQQRGMGKLSFCIGVWAQSPSVTLTLCQSRPDSQLGCLSN